MMSESDRRQPRHEPAHDGVAEDEGHTLDRSVREELAAEEDAHLGVIAVEAAEKVYGRYSKWFLFVGYVVLSSSFYLCLSIALGAYKTYHELHLIGRLREYGSTPRPGHAQPVCVYASLAVSTYSLAQLLGLTRTYESCCAEDVTQLVEGCPCSGPLIHPAPPFSSPPWSSHNTLRAC